MADVVLRRLAPADLTWFAALGPLNGTTPGLRIPIRIVRPVVQARRDRKLVSMTTVEHNGRDLVHASRPMRLHGQHWIVGPSRVRGNGYVDIRRNDIAFLRFTTREEATGREPKWQLTWAVLRQSNRSTAGLFEMCKEQLLDATTVRVRGQPAARLLSVAGRRLPAFGGEPAAADTGGLSDADWEDAHDWLLRYTRCDDLERLLDAGTSTLAAEVLRRLRRSRDERPHEDLATHVLRKYGVNLLDDAERREIVIDARYRRRRRERPVAVGRWHKAGPAVTTFVATIGLPTVMAGERTTKLPDFEDVDTFKPLGALHVYQEQLSRKIVATLESVRMN